MQSVSSRIWSRVAVSISYDDNHYTTGPSRVLNKYWKQHQTKQQLYEHLPQISQTIKLRYPEHDRSKDTLVRNVLLWIYTHEHTGVDWSEKS